MSSPTQTTKNDSAVEAAGTAAATVATTVATETTTATATTTVATPDATPVVGATAASDAAPVVGATAASDATPVVAPTAATAATATEVEAKDADSPSNKRKSSENAPTNAEESPSKKLKAMPAADKDVIMADSQSDETSTTKCC